MEWVARFYFACLEQSLGSDKIAGAVDPSVESREGVCLYTFKRYIFISNIFILQIIMFMINI